MTEKFMQHPNKTIKESAVFLTKKKKKKKRKKKKKKSMSFSL